MPADAWIVVLLKDFGTAKSRLSPALGAAQRRQLAEENGIRALRAATAVGPTLAVCGSQSAAALAARHGADVILEDDPAGQNPAAERGLLEVVRRGGGVALILSSDLPLIDAAALRRLFDRAAEETGPLLLAAAALGRSGTNALYLRPPHGITLQFGDASLPRFAAEAARRSRRFVVHEDAALALDVDEPSDLNAVARLQTTP